MSKDKQSTNDTENESSNSEDSNRKLKSDKKKKNQGEVYEEFIGPDSQDKKGDGDESSEPDGMGISEKAKRQPSDERDVSKGKS